MRVLLPTIGSHGDVYPILAVGRALARRGHSCTIATHGMFSAEIRAAGLEAAEILEGFPVEDTLRHPDLFHPVRSLLLGSRILDPLMRAFLDDFRPLVARLGPDVIAGHYVALPARWIAHEAGIPFASLVLAPTAWNAPDDPVPSYQLGSRPRDARRARMLEKLLDPVLQWFFRRWADRLYRRGGFAGRRADHVAAAPSRRRSPDCWEEFRAGDRVLALWPEAFRPALPSDPPGATLCGFPWLEDDPPLEESLRAFLDAGDPPIVFTLGSAAVHHPRGFYELAARACRRLGRRGVLLVGPTTPAPARLPAPVIARPWAPHARLFPRALANVHHGGIGTTARALRAGRPQVVVPHAYDQFNNGLRVHALGAGLTVPRHHLTLDRLVAALDRAARDEAIAKRAAETAARVAANGAEVAAGAIEALLARASVPVPARG